MSCDIEKIASHNGCNLINLGGYLVLRKIYYGIRFVSIRIPKECNKRMMNVLLSCAHDSLTYNSVTRKNAIREGLPEIVLVFVL